jgi:hypothetical protein
MILIGSVAARIRGVPMQRPSKDVDVVCDRAQFDKFVEENKARISKAEIRHGHRAHVFFHPDTKLPKVEFEFEQSPSDQILCGMRFDKEVPLLNTPLQVASPNILYLTKRSHANLPGNFEKNLQDLMTLKPHVSTFSDVEMDYYNKRKDECRSRFAKFRTSRFSLDLPNEDFFELSNHVRLYEHDDVHKAVAFEKGKPVYERCKRDVTRAKIDKDMFLALPKEIQLRMPQEEFIVIGIERYFLHDRQMSKKMVYSLGLVKTIRDLFTGWFQDYCLDNIEHLGRIPKHEFLDRFLEAEKAGEIRKLKKSVKPGPVRMIDQVVGMVKKGRFEDADRLLGNILGQDPDNSIALYYRGLVARKRDKLDDGIGYLRSSIKADETNWQAWNLLGLLLVERREFEEAANSFEQALKAKSDFLPALINGARTLEKLGIKDRAIALLHRARKLSPEDDVVLRTLGRLESA